MMSECPPRELPYFQSKQNCLFCGKWDNLLSIAKQTGSRAQETNKASFIIAKKEHKNNSPSREEQIKL